MHFCMMHKSINCPDNPGVVSLGESYKPALIRTKNAKIDGKQMIRVALQLFLASCIKETQGPYFVCDDGSVMLTRLFKNGDLILIAIEIRNSIPCLACEGRWTLITPLYIFLFSNLVHLLNQLKIKVHRVFISCLYHYELRIQ